MHLQEQTRPLRWPLAINNKIEHIETRGDAAFYEDVMAAYYMAVSGNGVAIMHDFIARKAVANGQLVPVLEPWTTVSHIYHIACPAESRKSAYRAFIDFLTEELAAGRRFSGTFGDSPCPRACIRHKKAVAVTAKGIQY